MVAVPTLSGALDSIRLGVTLMHEHIVIMNPEVATNLSGVWGGDAEIEHIRRELTLLKAAGVDTLVDLTVIGLGRNVALIRKIAEGTGVNVIVATGLYTFDELPTYFRLRGPGTRNGGPDPLEEMFVEDITNGIAGTDVRAAIIKCATDVKGLTPDVERVLRAAARAQLRTGVPISTHSDASTRRGVDQQRVLADEGVDLRRVIIGHCGDTTDVEYITGLIENGSYVGLDRFGFDLALPFETRVDVVVELVNRGYADRLLLSHDATYHSDFVDPDVLTAQLPNWRHDFIVSRVLPELSARGVGDADINRMMIGNPADIFGFSPQVSGRGS